METQLLPLSQDAVAQLNDAQISAAGALFRRRMRSNSTRRSSQSGEIHHPRALSQLLFKGLDVGILPPHVVSGQNSVFSSPNSPLVRRESLALGKRLSLAVWTPSGQVSFSGLPLLQLTRQICLENTYQTGPDEGSHFDANQVWRVLQDTLESNLAGVKYNAAAAGQLSQNLSDLMRGKVRDVTPPRYKLVCLVVLGQSGNQGVQVTSRCLWDTENDSSAVAVFQNSSLFAVAMVYGLYRE